MNNGDVWSGSRLFLALVALASTTGGCGGSAVPPPKAPPASAPATEMQAPAVMTAPEGASGPPPPASAPRSRDEGAAPAAATPSRDEAAAPPAPVVSPSTQEAPATMAGQVAADLRRAEHEIAAGDCPTACRALGSMERAVAFLCAVNQSADEVDRCANARRHLASARRRIRTTCGGCPGGPSVEPDAPVPSTTR
jgi:hypothetical protein